VRLVSDFAIASICIWAEARGEPYAGKIAVGEVIRNRCKAWNKSVAAVVFQPLQFSWTNSYDANRIVAFLCDDTDTVVRDCCNAWVASETSSLTGGARNYYNAKLVKPSWADTLVNPIVIGNHTFGTAP
jgi:N-acetylmuramoyl-L-alanine amidase